MDQAGQDGESAVKYNRDSRLRFVDAFFESIGEAVAMADSAGVIVAANNAFLRLTGRTLDELIGNTVEESARRYLSEAYAEALILAVESILDGMAAEPVELQIRGVTVTLSPLAGSPDSSGVLCRARRDVQTEEEPHLAPPGGFSQSLIDTIPDIIYRLDPGGAITYISPAVSRYGYRPEMLVGRDIIDLVHPGDREQAVHKLNDRRTGDRSTTLFEVRFLADEGVLTTSGPASNGNGWPVFLVSASGLYEATPPVAGGFLGTVGIARDISRRINDEREMLKTSRMLHNILRSSSRFAIIATDCTYRIMHINPAAEQLFAIEPGTVVGKEAPALLAGAGIDGTRLVDAFTAALSYGTYQFTVAVTGTAHHLLITIMPLRDPDARHSGYVIYAFDITDRKRAEEALLHYQRAVEGSSNLIAAVNREGSYVFANHAFLTYYGITRERVLGRTVAEVFGAERYIAEIQPHLDACFNGEEVHIERPSRSAVSGERYLSITYYPLKSSNGEIKGAVTLAEDITARREARRRIEETLAEKEKLIGELTRALDEVKTLRGFIPICAHCKKIRDDEGYWEQVEDYIQAHSDAEFSHSICPDCMTKYFPDVKPDEDKK